MSNKLLTNEEITQIRERAEKATEGPWQYNGIGGVFSAHAVSYHYAWKNTKEICSLNDGEYIENQNEENDANFIAHAREDIPKLLAEIERLRELLNKAYQYGTSSEAYQNESDIKEIYEYLYGGDRR